MGSTQRFAHDLQIAFDNNQAGQVIRMSKHQAHGGSTARLAVF